MRRARDTYTLTGSDEMASPGSDSKAGIGMRTPCRQLSSQIVSKDEIAEEIANRFSKSASDTTR